MGGDHGREHRPGQVDSVFRDEPASRRQIRSTCLLERATEALSTSLDYETSLTALAHALVPELADWCVVELVENRHRRVLALAHRDPSKVDVASRIRREYPTAQNPFSPGRHVVDTGEPILVEKIEDADLERYARTSTHLELLRALDLRSFLCVPILATGCVEGVITLMQAEPRRGFDVHDLDLAREVGRRAGTAISHARAYRAATDAVRARDDFLSVAAHELRTPLATIVLQLEGLKRVLATSSLPPAAAAERVEKTLEQTKRLTRLVDALLDVTRLTAGRLLLECEPLDLAELVRNVGERFADEVGPAKPLLTVSADTRCQGVWDGRRLEQVIANLLSNALKYGEGRPILLTCRPDADRVRVQVADQGIGVAPSDVHRIFDRFERAPSSHDRSGFGLGLWIAREIVSAHGGSIHVESEPGKGATFTVELPLQTTRPH